MPVFQYHARTLKGDLVNDKIDLPTRDDVIAHLRKNRMVVVQVRAAPKEFNLSFKFGGGVKTRDVVVFTRQFATMINAGLPLVQALDILAQQTENKILADVTRKVVYDVESGQTLADALRKHPKAFSDLYVNMVASRPIRCCSRHQGGATCCARRPCRGSPVRWGRSSLPACRSSTAPRSRRAPPATW